LLKPNPLKEIRVEKKFQNVDQVSAASGIKIAAPNLDDVIAGSPIATVHNEKDLERVKEELQTSIQEIEFEATGEGITLKADNLGSLEALVGVFKDRVAIKKAEIGKVLRKDVIEIEVVKDPLKKVIIAFNVDIDELASKEAKDKSLVIIHNNIIYKLIEEFDEFVKQQQEKIRQEKLSLITFPAKVKILSGHTFRASNPAIVGAEVLVGTIKTGFKLQKNGKEIGVIKAIQSENKTLQKAERGDKVAISIEGPIVGRHIREGDELATMINENDLKVLKELDMKEEVEIAEEILNH
jgi:translation initiation factor 5B